jgi:predicted kinase
MVARQGCPEVQVLIIGKNTSGRSTWVKEAKSLILVLDPLGIHIKALDQEKSE